MVVGRGNDAIPTWSGFNYQGKMMLLYVLELINQIAKDKNKDIDACYRAHYNKLIFHFSGKIKEVLA